MLGVSGWKFFEEPLGFYKFWWDFELSDWNLEI
jgi:hypothetical protein